MPDLHCHDCRRAQNLRSSVLHALKELGVEPSQESIRTLTRFGNYQAYLQRARIESEVRDSKTVEEFLGQSRTKRREFERDHFD
jgi:hypothetical protein